MSFSGDVRTRLLKSKIHRATVTDANLDYVGSITIDENLMDAVGIIQYEQVLVTNITNGTRHETYTITGPRGSGMICINGAAAHLAGVGDKIIIMAFGDFEKEEIAGHKPKVVLVDGNNKPVSSISERTSAYRDKVTRSVKNL